jgi:hypothetical protein
VVAALLAHQKVTPCRSADTVTPPA